MAAKLDFQLVGWLSKEKDKSAKIDDFVTTLKQLHDQMEWPKPSIENVRSNSNDNGSTMSHTPVTDNTESGYHSNEPENFAPFYGAYPSKSGNLMEGKFHDVVEANLLPKMEMMSVTSEQVSLWDDDKAMSGQVFANFELEDQTYHAIEEQKKKDANSKQAIQKMEIKLRYLLQLFIEGDCLEFSLLLSIMLLDKAAVVRITNKAIRSNSLILCRKLRNGLKDITRWSLYECLGYQSFMLSLKSQISILDNFVIREESISPVLAMMNNKETLTEHHSHNSSDNSLKENNESEIKQKLNDSKILNTSGASTSSTTNTIERKISVEEKRSVTNSRSSINNNQQLNESSISSSSTNDHSKNSVPPANISNVNDDEDDEKNELIEESEDGRCIVM
jgi:hypothetical protein